MQNRTEYLGARIPYPISTEENPEISSTIMASVRNERDSVLRWNKDDMRSATKNITLLDTAIHTAFLQTRFRLDVCPSYILKVITTLVY